MTRMLQLVFVLAVEPTSAAWKHRQLFQAEAPAVHLQDTEAVLPAAEVESSWRRSFEDGLRQSRTAASKEEGFAWGHRWVAERSRSGAVPAEMLSAEQLMEKSLQEAPAELREQQSLLFATRLYYHAKWLAERQHASVAEERYRRSKDLALALGNEDLAAHALSRLGYFLTIWGRADEAREVLNEAVAVAHTKPNNVASYLLGKLERKVATSTGDAKRLVEADSRIMASQKVPSKDLEEERQQLIAEISYWHSAELSLSKCLDSDNFMQILICGAVHAARAAHQAFL